MEDATPDELRALATKLCIASLVLKPSEKAQVRQLWEASKAYLKESALRLLATDRKGPCLLQLFADEWSSLVRSRTGLKHVDHDFHCWRQGRLRSSFLLMRALQGVTGATGVDSRMIFQEPVPLAAGKSYLHLFSALCAFVSIPRKNGHLGISTTTYCFDGAVHKPMEGVCRARHALYYTEGCGPMSAPEHVLLSLADWVLIIRCIAHALSLSCHWGLDEFTSDDTTTNIHIGVESLRKSSTAILAVVPDFVIKHMRADPRPQDRDGAFKYWSALSVKRKFMEQLLEVNPRWDGDVLYVNPAVLSRPDAYAHVCDTIRYLLQWTQFSDTRWAGIGPCCRKLVRSMSIGLDRMVEMVVADKTITNYDLHGFERLQRPDRLWFACASLALIPVESVCAEVLADDRLLRRHADLKGLFAKEIDWLRSLDCDVYDRVAATVCRETTGLELHDDVMRAALASRCYAQEHVFKQLDVYPFLLLFGSVRENLERSRRAKETDLTDPTTKQIWALLRRGVTYDPLCAETLGHV
jgi:hypothetical protein